MQYETLIIGGGLSGLAAAVRLAHFGKKVVVVERHHRLGGLNSWYRRQDWLIDTGLHAMTNFAPPGARRAPLNRMLRQLRIPYEALDLVPQTVSSVRFPEVALPFTNSFADFTQSVRQAFPSQFDGFLKLVDRVERYDVYSYNLPPLSARRVLTETVGEGLLQEMLLCPLMFYGSASEHDMDFRQFAILFASVLMQGLARPKGGIVALLGLLEERIRESGGEIWLGHGVERIDCADGRVRRVVLDDGRAVACDSVLSSAGRVETLALCRGVDPAAMPEVAPGRMSFVESIFFLDRPPVDVGLRECIAFVNRDEVMHFADPGCLVDERSATVCLPQNFAFAAADGLEMDNVVRITSIASCAAWRRLPPPEYAAGKRRVRERQMRFLAGLGHDLAGHVVGYDTFTPLTIERFTGHRGGAIYGTPDKSFDGTTPIAGLYLCGTDQGFLGIVGALLSGVSMANYHVLRRP